jgi:hypothetical protein
MSDDKQDVLETQNNIRILVPAAVIVQLLRDHGDCNVELPAERPSCYLRSDNRLELEWTFDGPSPMPF